MPVSWLQLPQPLQSLGQLALPRGVGRHWMGSCLRKAPHQEPRACAQRRRTAARGEPSACMHACTHTSVRWPMAHGRPDGRPITHLRLEAACGPPPLAFASGASYLYLFQLHRQAHAASASQRACLAAYRGRPGIPGGFFRAAVSSIETPAGCKWHDCVVLLYSTLQPDAADAGHALRDAVFPKAASWIVHVLRCAPNSG